MQLQRAEELLAKNAGTAVARDQALAGDQSAQGQITIDEANLRTAEINLGYTEITSPITGEIGRTKVTKGNVVGPDSGPLTVIVSRDPMYVTFPVSQRVFLTLAGRSQVGAGALTVRIRFSDGAPTNDAGRINFVDVTVDRATDSVTCAPGCPIRLAADRWPARPRVG